MSLEICVIFRLNILEIINSYLYVYFLINQRPNRINHMIRFTKHSNSNNIDCDCDHVSKLLSLLLL